MSERVALLESLIRPKLLGVSGKIKYWYGNMDINIQEGEDWTTSNSLTLEKFLAMQPCPKEESDMTLYGIAWEFVWGKKPPEAITQAREDLIRKAGLRESLSPAEELWLKLMVVDTDEF